MKRAAGIVGMTLAIAAVAGGARAQHETGDAGAGVSSGAGTETEAGTEAETETEAETGSGAETGAGTDAAGTGTDAGAGTGTEAGAGAGTGTGAEDGSARAPSPAGQRPKVAIVIGGDPDPVLVAAAMEVEALLALAGELRMPADVRFRAALRGAEPEAQGDRAAVDDGLADVRAERRQLGGSETEDAPILARLGRRAGAALVLVVREGASGPEAVALDVRNAQFFEGTLALAEPEAETVATFVLRRARVAARGAAAAQAVSAEGPSGPEQAAAEAVAGAGAPEEPPAERDWFEQHWPYFAAGALLAAAVVFVVVTATDGGDPPPMLRFQPPGTP